MSCNMADQAWIRIQLFEMHVTNHRRYLLRNDPTWHFIPCFDKASWPIRGGHCWELDGNVYYFRLTLWNSRGGIWYGTWIVFVVLTASCYFMHQLRQLKPDSSTLPYLLSKVCIWAWLTIFFSVGKYHMVLPNYQQIKPNSLHIWLNIMRV